MQAAKMARIAVTIEKMRDEAKKKGWEVISAQPYNHPDDTYMVKCAIKNEKGEYVSYIFNRGFQLGHYFNSMADAVDSMYRR